MEEKEESEEEEDEEDDFSEDEESDEYSDITHELGRLPTQQDYEERIKASNVFIEEDPSQKYELLKQIGMGGFARVFLCKERETGRFAALKYVDPKN